MTTVAADVFHVSTSTRHVFNPVPADDADRRMCDVREIFAPLQKSVAAVAGKLVVPVAMSDEVDVVAEQTAEIPDFLLEDGRIAIRIVAGVEQQWMTALHAHVFGVWPSRSISFLYV
jgi:hypothetical protein